MTYFEIMPNKDYINIWCEDAIDDMVEFDYKELRQFFNYNYILFTCQINFTTR